nr:methyl-CpG-binding domain-containing protein 9 [Tanacetum cinerariifolium]
MVEATLVLETMIKPVYIKNSWLWCWSSVSIAAKKSTISALAFRICSLDAAIDYEKQAATLKKTYGKEKKHLKNSKGTKQVIKGTRQLDIPGNLFIYSL